MMKAVSQRRFGLRFTWVLAVVLLPTMESGADEAAILNGIREFFAAADDSGAARSARREIVEKLRSDSEYDPAKIHDWLHRAGLFAPREPGLMTIRAADGPAAALPIAIRIPKGYDPQRPWPLIYALHGTGGRGE